jgi:hypothetical protein
MQALAAIVAQNVIPGIAGNDFPRRRESILC